MQQATEATPTDVQLLQQRLERSELARVRLREAASAGLAANAELQKEIAVRSALALHDNEPH